MDKWVEVTTYLLMVLLLLHQQRICASQVFTLSVDEEEVIAGTDASIICTLRRTVKGTYNEAELMIDGQPMDVEPQKSYLSTDNQHADIIYTFDMKVPVDRDSMKLQCQLEGNTEIKSNDVDIKINGLNLTIKTNKSVKAGSYTEVICTLMRAVVPNTYVVDLLQDEQKMEVEPTLSSTPSGRVTATMVYSFNISVLREQASMKLQCQLNDEQQDVKSSIMEVSIKGGLSLTINIDETIQADSDTDVNCTLKGAVLTTFYPVVLVQNGADLDVQPTRTLRDQSQGGTVTLDSIFNINVPREGGLRNLSCQLKQPRIKSDIVIPRILSNLTSLEASENQLNASCLIHKLIVKSCDSVSLILTIDGITVNTSQLYQEQVTQDSVDCQYNITLLANCKEWTAYCRLDGNLQSDIKEMGCPAYESIPPHQVSKKTPAETVVLLVAVAVAVILIIAAVIAVILYKKNKCCCNNCQCESIHNESGMPLRGQL